MDRILTDIANTGPGGRAKLKKLLKKLVDDTPTPTPIPTPSNAQTVYTDGEYDPETLKEGDIVFKRDFVSENGLFPPEDGVLDDYSIGPDNPIRVRPQAGNVEEETITITDTDSNELLYRLVGHTDIEADASVVDIYDGQGNKIITLPYIDDSEQEVNEYLLTPDTLRETSIAFSITYNQEGLIELYSGYLEDTYYEYYKDSLRERNGGIARIHGLPTEESTPEELSDMGFSFELWRDIFGGKINRLHIESVLTEGGPYELVVPVYAKYSESFGESPATIQTIGFDDYTVRVDGTMCCNKRVLQESYNDEGKITQETIEIVGSTDLVSSGITTTSKHVKVCFNEFINSSEEITLVDEGSSYGEEDIILYKIEFYNNEYDVKVGKILNGENIIVRDNIYEYEEVTLDIEYLSYSLKAISTESPSNVAIYTLTEDTVPYEIFNGVSTPRIPAYPIILTDAIDSTRIKPNEPYDFDELIDDIEFGLEPVIYDEILNKYTWMFDIGSTVPNVTWPSDVIWENGTSPVLSADTHYEVSVKRTVSGSKYATIKAFPLV